MSTSAFVSPQKNILIPEQSSKAALVRSGSPRSAEYANKLMKTENSLDVGMASPSALSRSSTFHDGIFPGEQKLRLVSFNIHGWRDTFHNDNLAGIISALKKMSPDVVALQEVLHPYRPPTNPEAAEAYYQRVKSGKGNGFVPDYMDGSNEKPYLQVLADALGLPHISFGQAVDDGYFGTFGYGNAIISRYPVVSEKHIVCKPDEKFQAGRRIEAEDRCFSVVTLQTGLETEHTFCVTHLDQLDDQLRLNQVNEMLGFASEVGPHILAGDFNVFQRSDCSEEQWQAILDDASSKNWNPPPETTAAIQEVLSQGYKDCFYLSENHINGSADEDLHVNGMANDTKNPGATCWVIKPLLRIDYAFLSKGYENARVRQYQRVLDESSDHFPVVIDLALPALDQSSSETDSTAMTDDTE